MKSQTTPVDVWPSGDGWTPAYLRLEPDELQERYGLEFEDGVDGLDYYLLAAIADFQVGQFWLFRHLRAPCGGTEVIVDLSISRDDAIAAVKRQLHLKDADFAWLAETNRSPLLEIFGKRKRATG